ncbi:hypothetical protein HGRIS_004658 [Hohenbuehelia grisea]|uniref:PH domain-containing protein n=1 Tax=Hohenbuehelia grisea TaxID=104357 RepID=A0ABR3JCZ2_9AGAR
MPSSSLAASASSSSAPPAQASMSPQPPSSGSPSSTTAPLTVPQLLEIYASTPEPYKAALDHAVTDRNALSSQNAQLWKLIEKQRSGYGQILRDLERVRAERDHYRQRSATAQDRDKPKDSSRRLKDKPPELGDTSPHDAHGNTTPKLSKQWPDDPTPRSSSSASSSASHLIERERAESTSSVSSSMQHYAATAPSTPVHHRVQASQRINPSPSPLSVASTPSRSGSLPMPIIQPNEMSTSRKQSLGDSSKASPSDHAQGNTKPTDQPHQIPSQSQAFTHLGYNNIIAGATSPNPDSLHLSSIETSNANSPIERPLVSSPTSQVTSPTLPHKTLSPQTPFATRDFSRDSRISLPDEARQYIVNMADSPIPSPQLPGAPSNTRGTSAANDKNPSGKATTRDVLPTSIGVMKVTNGSTPSIHKLRDDVSPENLYNQPSSGIPAQPSHGPPPPLVTIEPASAAQPAFSPTISSPDKARAVPNGVGPQDKDGRGAKEGPENALGSMFLDMGEESGLDDDSASRVSRESAQAPSAQNPREQPPRPKEPERERKAAKSRAAVEDFPLPPSTATLPPQAQAFAEVQQLLGDIPQGNSASSSQSHPASGVSSYASSTTHLVNSSSGNTPSIPPSSSAASNPQSMASSTTTFFDSIPPSAGEFRALPLLPSDLPTTTVTVTSSFVRPNDRGKEVLSFVIFVNPRGRDPSVQGSKGKAKESWNVEKMYSDVLGLDSRVRSSVGKGLSKKIAALPEGRLWKDHAPAKVDQRKAVLESYLQMLVQLPVKNNNEVIAFLTSDIVRETKKPVLQAGHKEGYLTKRGKNFGGWKTRYFMLQGPALEYYDCRGGTHLGSIAVAGAQIGRQQRTDQRAPMSDEEKEYRHAFLIVEAKKGPGGNHPRHVLCAESDEERDAWVEILVRYFTGAYTEEGATYATRGPSPITTSAQPTPAQIYQEQQTRMLHSATSAPRSSSSIDLASSTAKRAGDNVMPKGAAMSTSQLPVDTANLKYFQNVPQMNVDPTSSPVKSKGPSPVERSQPSGVPFSDAQTAKRLLERNVGLSTSLPDSSSSTPAGSTPDGSSTSSPARSNSEMGHYPDMERLRGQARQHSPETHRREREGETSQGLQPPGPADRIPSPEKMERVKISGPINGAPIPAGYKFGGKDLNPAESTPSAGDRREKAKSRWFTGFSRPSGGLYILLHCLAPDSMVS